MNENYELLKDYPDVLTFKELQIILRYGRTKTYRLLKDRKIISFRDRDNNEYRILKVSVIDYLTRTLNTS